MNNVLNIIKSKPLVALLAVSVVMGLLIALATFLRSQRAEKVGVNDSSRFEEPVNNKIAVQSEENEDVVVNNVYKSDVHTYESGTTVFEKSEFYQLLYSPEDNTFDITILTADFPRGRALAEAALIDELGISREEACDLKVRIYTHPQLNPAEADNEYGLSFCE